VAFLHHEEDKIDHLKLKKIFKTTSRLLIMLDLEVIKIWNEHKGYRDLVYPNKLNTLRYRVYHILLSLAKFIFGLDGAARSEV
jgi:hypothetical protein